MKIMEVVKQIQKLELEINELIKVKEEHYFNRNLTVVTKNQFMQSLDLQIEISNDKMRYLIEQLEACQPEKPFENLPKQDLIPKAYLIKFVSQSEPEKRCSMVVIEHSKEEAVRIAECHVPSNYVVENVIGKRNGLVYDGYEEINN